MTKAVPVSVLLVILAGACCSECPSDAGPGSSQPTPSRATSPASVDTVADNQAVNAFILAARKGDLEAVKTALASGIPVDSKYRDPEFLGTRSGYTALMYAAMGHQAVVEELLRSGADVNAARGDGKSAMYYAVHSQRPNPRIIEILKKAGSTEDPKRLKLTTRLIRAACKDWNWDTATHAPYYPGVPRDLKGEESIADVLAAGADINWADPAGFTPLMYAANLGLLDAVKELISRGAKVDAVSRNGDTALSMARQYDLEEVIQQLTAAAKR